MDEQRGPLAALWGEDFSTGYVVAILPDDDAAREARDALTAAGVDADDVRVHTGQDVVERHDRFLQDRAAAERRLAALASDERDALDEYIEEAREGSGFVTVRAPDDDRVKRAHAVLSDVGAYGVRYDDRATLRDLD